MIHRTLGLDLALRHGALVRAEWDSDNPVRLRGYNVLVEWEGRLGMNSSEHEMMILGNEIVHALAQHEGMPCGMDWDTGVPHWGGRKAQVKLSFLLGYVTRGCAANGVIPVFIAPQLVRTSLGLSKNLKKEQVWQYAGLPSDSSDSDVKDALLLSYLVLNGARPSGGPTTSVDLSSFRVARENPKNPALARSVSRRSGNRPVNRPKWTGRSSHPAGHAGASAQATPPAGEGQGS